MKGSSLYLPKIFSCLSITVLYNSVSLNHDFSSREEKIFTATFSPCQLPLHTSPYLPFPAERHTQVTWRVGQKREPINLMPATLNPSCLLRRTQFGAVPTTFRLERNTKIRWNLPLLSTLLQDQIKHPYCLHCTISC